MANRQPTANPINTIVGIAMIGLVFVALFYLAKGVFWILSLVAPVLLLITLFIDHKVVVDFGKWALNLFSKNLLAAIGVIGGLAALSFIGGPNLIAGVIFPTIATFLFGKALLKRKFNELRADVERRTNGTTTDVEYEDVTEDIEVEDITTLELPETLDLEDIPPQKPIQQTRGKGKGGNQYDDFFE